MAYKFIVSYTAQVGSHIREFYIRTENDIAGTFGTATRFDSPEAAADFVYGRLDASHLREIRIRRVRVQD